MAEIIFWLTSSFYFTFLIFNIISWVFLWEEKEFSLTRLFIYLKESKQGRSLIFGTGNLIKWFSILLYGLTIFWGGDFYYHLLVAGIYLYLFVRTVIKLYNRELIIPKITLNTYKVTILKLKFTVVFYMYPPLDMYLWMLIVDRLTPLFLLLFTSVSLVILDFQKDSIINRAIDKIDKYKNILTVAVVGSFAKGSTKEFITRILSIKFNVSSNDTPLSSSLGIARTILLRVTSRTQIFVVEMEDYKAQDIDEMSNIAKPKIAVITGINDEKVSIFGSLNKIIDSKFEIVNNLPREGIVVLNGNNNNSLSLSNRIKYKKFVFSSQAVSSGIAGIRAQNIKLSKFSLSFDVHVFGKKYKLANIKLIGEQNVENLLPGIFLGLYLGIDFSSIRREIEKILPLSRTMDPSKTIRGAVLVNDSNNAHLNSVKNATSYMKLYKGKRILVMEPLGELGKNSNTNHLEIGREIGKVCDYLFLTNSDYYKPLVTGIKKEKSKCTVSVMSPLKIANFIQNNCAHNDVVVFEGRQAYNSFSLIASERVYPV